MNRFLLITAVFFISMVNATEQDDVFAEGQKAFLDKEYNRAHGIWLPLASSGYAPAQDTIGYLYSNGLGVKQDHEKAVEWYKKAVDSSHLEAMFNLGNAYRLGKGVSKDFAKAEDLYRKSYCSGYKYSVVGLAALYYSGNLQPKSEAEEIALKKDLERLKDPRYRQWLINITKDNQSLNNPLNRTCYAHASHAN